MSCKKKEREISQGRKRFQLEKKSRPLNTELQKQRTRRPQKNKKKKREKKTLQGVVDGREKPRREKEGGKVLLGGVRREKKCVRRLGGAVRPL